MVREYAQKVLTREMGGIQVSIIVPVFDERESLPHLYRGLREVLDGLGQAYEILVVDDGSSDGSTEIIQKLVHDDPHVRGIHFTRNFGRAAALTAGFQFARGQVIVSIDGDLQHDPHDIPRLLAKLDEGYDVVSGWRTPRHDPPDKTIPSFLFNTLVRLTTGLRVHDLGCGLKAYRRQTAASLRLYGGIYRYIQVLAHMQGYRVTELPIVGHQRRFGHSKFAMSRLHGGFFDLLTVLFLSWYRKRPLHLFGGLGFMGMSAGTIICAYLTVLWFLGERPIGNRPLLLLGVLLIIVGIQLLTLGFLADMINAAFYRSDDLYVIREREGFAPAEQG